MILFLHKEENLLKSEVNLMLALNEILQKAKKKAKVWIYIIKIYFGIFHPKSQYKNVFSLAMKFVDPSIKKSG